MSTIKANSPHLGLPETSRLESSQSQPIAVANTALPANDQAQASSLKQGESQQTSGVTQDAQLKDTHQAVQQQLTEPPRMTQNELKRLLNAPAQRRQLGRVLQQAPALKSAFLKHPGGEAVLDLLQQPHLSPDQTRKVQLFLAQHTQVNLGYPGHTSGIDGQYGQRTHQALLALLNQELVSASTPSAPAAESPATYQGPGEVLNHLSVSERQAIQKQHPQVYQLLTQGRLTATEVKQLQQALVDAGHDLSYRGHATGVDGDFGKRSKAALNAFVAELQSAASPTVPELPAEPEVPQLPTPPETPDSAVAQPTFRVEDSLNQLAKQALDLPAEQRERLPQDLQDALRQIAAGDQSQSTAKALQQALVDMGQKLNYPGHSTGIDGQPGQRTRQALVNVAESAVTGQAAAVTKAGPFPHYDRMLEDNLLDMTLAIGYDEGSDRYASAHIFEQRKMLSELADRGFVRNDAKALELLKAAGQDLKADYTALYVKENISEKDGKPVHAIVRVIHAGDGTQGAEKRAAAIESMNQSDVFMYGGHARYGTGIDFDRNFTVTIDWNGVKNAPASGKVTYRDYGELKDLLGGNAQANQWLSRLEQQGKIEIEGSNAGNVRMSEKDLHRAEFGSRLMNKALEGVENTLSEEIQGDRYRLWLFNGCRTVDYMPSIQAEGRENPTALGSKNLDIMTTEQTLYWQNISASLMSFLDGVMAEDGTPDLMQRMEQANPQQASRATHSVHGFADNPKQ